jgi:hypothetical protein
MPATLVDRWTTGSTIIRHHRGAIPTCPAAPPPAVVKRGLVVRDARADLNVNAGPRPIRRYTGDPVKCSSRWVLLLIIVSAGLCILMDFARVLIL